MVWNMSYLGLSFFYENTQWQWILYFNQVFINDPAMAVYETINKNFSPITDCIKIQEWTP